MTRKTWISALILLTALCACGGKPAETSEPAPAAPAAGSEQTTTVVVAEPAPAPEAAAPTPAPAPAAEPQAEKKLPPIAAVASFKVKDFDAWKKSFDEGQPARQAAGVVAHHVSRGVDDAKLVVVYLVATDQPKLEAFYKSPELKKAMKAAGVQGKPTMHVLTPVESTTASDPKMAAVLVTHEVKDYDAWKKVFDEDAPARAQGGVVGYGLARDASKPNVLVIYLQAASIEPLKGFGASKELKEKMKAAGVKGKPEMLYVQGVEWTQYN